MTIKNVVFVHIGKIKIPVDLHKNKIAVKVPIDALIKNPTITFRGAYHNRKINLHVVRSRNSLEELLDKREWDDKTKMKTRIIYHHDFESLNNQLKNKNLIFTYE